MRIRLGAATALAIVLSAQSGLALTPEEAWAGWQSMAAALGHTVTAAATARNGDTLVVTGVSIGMTVPDGPQVSSAMAEVNFRDRGDGSVEISYPPSYDVTLTFPGKGPTPPSAVLSFTRDQMVLVGSGTAEAPKFDFTAKGITGTVKQVIGPDGKPADVKGDLTMTDLAGSYVALPSPGGQTYDTSMTVGAMSVKVAATDPQAQVTANLDLSVTQFQAAGKSTMVTPALMQATDLSAALAAGFMMDASYRTGGVNLLLDVTEGGRPGHVEATLAGTTAHMQLDADQIDYGYSLTGGDIKAQGFDIPMPLVSGAFGELAFGVAMPLKAATDPQDFAALVKVVDLTMAEDLWNMFDPGGALKRDPVTLIVDLDGKGAWTVDILDPAVQVMDMPDMPARLFSLDLTQVLVKAAGAQVAAAGGLTFDNEDLQSFDGFPAPLGKVTVTLDGINALLDALVAIGLVSQDDLMGTRMGLAMMARPGAGPDQLVSEIEFKKGGSLFVNGVQMQ